MRLIDQFQKLHTLLAKTPEQPGLPALAKTLNCSERNARLLLRKMEEKGWLHWEAARGRGHFSRLTMLASPQQVALDHLSGLLADGELEEAFASLDGEQRKLLMARLPDFLHAPQASGSRNRLRIPLSYPIEALDPTGTTDACAAVRKPVSSACKCRPKRSLSYVTFDRISGMRLAAPGLALLSNCEPTEVKALGSAT